MRILLHGINYSPELTGIGKYSGELAEWLASHSYAVRVVTAPPYYPEWKVRHGYAQWQYRQEAGTHSDIRVFRCPLWIPRKVTKITRLIHLASFAVFSFPIMLRQIFWKPDVVIIVAPALFCAPGGWLTARLCGAQAWLHVQDFEVDAAFEMGILKSRQLRKPVSRVERFLCSLFDRVSTISSRMVEKLGAKGVASDRQVLFPNWADTEAIAPLSAGSPMRTELGISDDQIVVLYSGNMGEKQGLDTLLEAAVLLQDKPSVHFILCGTGAARERLETRYAHLANVRWLPLQPVERLNDLLNMANIHALPQRADVADLVMPSKLTGMLASGRPTVAGAAPGTQVAQVVEQCGLVVPPEDSPAFAAAIERLINDATLRLDLGQAARRYAVEHLSKEAILSQFESELLELRVG